jgi:hypothetical protein
LFAFVEKGTHNEGLNLWASLGADTAEQEKNISSSVKKSFESVVDLTTYTASALIGAVYNPATAIFKKATGSNKRYELSYYHNTTLL